jgi:hypothetical protein
MYEQHARGAKAIVEARGGPTALGLQGLHALFYARLMDGYDILQTEQARLRDQSGSDACRIESPQALVSEIVEQSPTVEHAVERLSAAGTFAGPPRRSARISASTLGSVSRLNTTSAFTTT